MASKPSVKMFLGASFGITSHYLQIQRQRWTRTRLLGNYYRKNSLIICG